MNFIFFFLGNKIDKDIASVSAKYNTHDYVENFVPNTHLDYFFYKYFYDKLVKVTRTNILAVDIH